MKQLNSFKKILFWLAAAFLLACTAAILIFINRHPLAIYLLMFITFALICLATFVVATQAKNSIDKYFLASAKSIGSVDSTPLPAFGIAVMVTSSGNEIIWYNDRFAKGVLREEDKFGQDRSAVFSQSAIDTLDSSRTAEVEYAARNYRVFSLPCYDEYAGQTMYFFCDETENHSLKTRLQKTAVCVFFIHIDGLDLLLRNAPESQKNQIVSAIEAEIEKIDPHGTGHLQKISSKVYLLMMSRESYDEVFARKFDALRAVRELDFGERGGTTLTIGVGLGSESIAECVTAANSALEMAIGRGGDQAVIKSGENFEFFGGVTETKQVTTAVRARLLSQTLKKLISESSNVLIMGHSHSDMDAYGSAYALYCAAKRLEKEAQIVCNYNDTVAGSLIQYTAKHQENDSFILSPGEALGKITPKTLLIIVDAQRKDCLESVEVYEKCRRVVLVDHHRRNFDHITNSLMFYHDPNSSSTCEMVTEMLKFFGEDFIDSVQANALLAGIMLDTNNYVLRTSQNTFAAAGYLRERGANPVLLRELFADSMESYTIKSKTVADAKIIGNFAVAFCDSPAGSARIAAAQAADELLNIGGIEAAFVVFKMGERFNISARSLGKINVQTVMEELGGGGHQTMAAAQVEADSPRECSRLIETAFIAANEKVN